MFFCFQNILKHVNRCEGDQVIFTAVTGVPLAHLLRKISTIYPDYVAVGLCRLIASITPHAMRSIVRLGPNSRVAAAPTRLPGKGSSPMSYHAVSNSPGHGLFRHSKRVNTTAPSMYSPKSNVLTILKPAGQSERPWPTGPSNVTQADQLIISHRRTITLRFILFCTMRIQRPPLEPNSSLPPT